METFYVGANTPTRDIVSAIADRKAELLLLSATMTFHLSSVREVIREVRAYGARGVKIMVGGYPFNLAHGLWRAVGADATRTGCHGCAPVGGRERIARHGARDGDAYAFCTSCSTHGAVREVRQAGPGLWPSVGSRRHACKCSFRVVPMQNSGVSGGDLQGGGCPLLAGRGGRGRCQPVPLALWRGLSGQVRNHRIKCERGLRAGAGRINSRGGIVGLREPDTYRHALAENRIRSDDPLRPLRRVDPCQQRAVQSPERTARSNAALTRQREWLWNILAGLDDAVFATGTDGMVSFMNRAATLMSGREPPGGEAVPLDELLRIVQGPEPNSKPIFLRPAWAERRIIIIEGHLLQKAPRALLPVAGVASPLLDQTGLLMGALVILRDMTSAVHVQQLVMESERLSVASEMAVGIAHTVNNALLVISGNAQALEAHVPLGRRRQLDNIRAGVRRISDLTGRLLGFTDSRPSRSPKQT